MSSTCVWLYTLVCLFVLFELLMVILILGASLAGVLLSSMLVAEYVPLVFDWFFILCFGLVSVGVFECSFLFMMIVDYADARRESV